MTKRVLLTVVLTLGLAIPVLTQSLPEFPANSGAGRPDPVYPESPRYLQFGKELAYKPAEVRLKVDGTCRPIPREWVGIDMWMATEDGKIIRVQPTSNAQLVSGPTGQVVVTRLAGGQLTAHMCKCKKDKKEAFNDLFPPPPPPLEETVAEAPPTDQPATLPSVYNSASQRQSLRSENNSSATGGNATNTNSNSATAIAKGGNTYVLSLGGGGSGGSYSQPQYREQRGSGVTVGRREPRYEEPRRRGPQAYTDNVGPYARTDRATVGRGYSGNGVTVGQGRGYVRGSRRNR